MLFLHDVHMVMGEREFDFEDAVRDEYAPAVAEGGARLLWYLHSTHGSGEAYKMITVTAVPDGAVWERLNERLRYGDLAEWRGRADAMRYSASSELLVQPAWSPLAALDLEDIPARPETEHDEIVFRQDILQGVGIAESLASAPSGEPDDVLECVAAFAPALSDDSTVYILYRVAPRDRWTAAFAADSGWNDWTGSLTPALPDGVRSTMQMLRTVPWSPLR